MLWTQYLDVGEEMWVTLHVPACKLKVVFLFPTVQPIWREALVELETKKEVNKSVGSIYVEPYIIYNTLDYTDAWICKQHFNVFIV